MMTILTRNDLLSWKIKGQKIGENFYSDRFIGRGWTLCGQPAGPRRGVGRASQPWVLIPSFQKKSLPKGGSYVKREGLTRSLRSARPFGVTTCGGHRHSLRSWSNPGFSSLLSKKKASQREAFFWTEGLTRFANAQSRPSGDS